jgi:predicted esterase
MEQSLQFNFRARYYKSDDITPHTAQIWYVLHGYGQLADFFIRKFSILTKKNIVVIAPEGLSHFYLEDLQTRTRGGSDRVGSTWMTRENRQMDIENYITYLDTIHKKEMSGLKKIPVTILGFSQGAATATRWALQGKIDFEQLILWAGIFPPDMDFAIGHQILQSKKVMAVFGNEDPLVTPERIREMNSLSSQLGIDPAIINFVGGHDIDESTLQNLVV